jgi:hypothetical protein
MAVFSKGKELALGAIGTAGVKITLFGQYEDPQQQITVQTDLSPETFSFAAPNSPDGGITFNLASSSPVTFEITSQILDGFNDQFIVTAIKILDTNDDVLIFKQLASPVTYNDPGEFVVESYTLTIPN